MSELLPNARLGLLSEKKITDKTISALDELKTDDNEVFLDIKASKVNEKGSELLEENGYTFEAWTVDNIKTAKKMYEYGATGITTDKLLDDEVYQYLNEAYEK